MCWGNVFGVTCQKWDAQLTMRVSRGDDTRDRVSEQMKTLAARREAARLLRIYFSISKPVVRGRISELVKLIATTPTEE